MARCREPRTTRGGARVRHAAELLSAACVAAALACGSVRAEQVSPAPTEQVSPSPAVAPTLPMADTAPLPERDWLQLKTAAVVLGVVGGTLAYGKAKWWQDGFSSDFKAVSEGWFGQGTTYGGADKLGHAMFAYAGTRLFTRAFEWAGQDSARALQFGFWTTVGTLLGVEVLDGYAKGWSFSREDAVADIIGGLLGVRMETTPALDALIDFRLQYSPSTAPDGSKRSYDPLSDYSGQRYMAIVKASGIPALAQQPVLRFLEVGIGYGTRNFESESRVNNTPTRHMYFSLSLNLSELLRATVYSGNATPSRTQRFTETLFEYIQVPAVTVSKDRVLD
jgi:hypothetical protein